MSYFPLFSGGVLSSGSGPDPDAAAFILAAGITDTTQKNAINQLVVDLKGFGLWSGLFALYPMVGGTLTTCSYNLTNPALYRISWFGGISADATGVIGDGVGGFGDTGFKPEDIGIVGSLSSYANVFTVPPPFTALIGSESSDGSQTYDIFLATGSYAPYATYGGVVAAAAGGDPAPGLYSISRSDDSTLRADYNGALAANGAGMVSNTGTGANYGICARNIDTAGASALFYGTQALCAFHSAALSSPDSANFYAAVQAYQTALGRQV